MAAIEMSSLPQAQKEELLCTYAALILHDEKVAVTPENITKLVKASGANVEPFLPVLFARALGDISIGDLLSSAGTIGATAGGAAPVAAGGAVAQAAPAEEKVEEAEEEEEEDDMGFSLFD